VKTNYQAGQLRVWGFDVPVQVPDCAEVHTDKPPSFEVDRSIDPVQTGTVRATMKWAAEFRWIEAKISVNKLTGHMIIDSTECALRCGERS
jgi:hypothetical protein